MRCHRLYFATLALLLVSGALLCGIARAAEFTFTLAEVLGRTWSEETVVHAIEAPPGVLQRGPVSVRLRGARQAAQWQEIQLHEDGSIRAGRLWFRLGLAPYETVAVTVDSAQATDPGDAVSFCPVSASEVILSNRLTAVRLAWGDAAGEGPIRGVRLASGAWSGYASWSPPAGASTTNISTAVLAAGPLVVRTRTAYALDHGGRYELIVSLRAGEAIVRFDERYHEAGTLQWSFAEDAVAPDRVASVVQSRGEVNEQLLDYRAETPLTALAGWDLYYGDRSHAVELHYGKTDDVLALISTDADWLPAPAPQLIRLAAAPGPLLHADASLQDGHRHWGLLSGNAADFDEPGRDSMRWWCRQVALPLAKVIQWQLVWPEMDEIAFPHTFFDRMELPGIRERLRRTPEIEAFMADLRHGRNGKMSWGAARQRARAHSPERGAAFDVYEQTFSERGGLPGDVAAIATAYLYFNEDVFLDQLATGADGQDAAAYLDTIIDYYREDLGPFAALGRGAYMHVTDILMQHYLAIEFLLGSDTLAPQKKQQILSKLACVVYLMHEAEWQPPIHMPDGRRPKGYPQGSPNQKHCAFAGRAITACMLANHPDLPAWIDFALAEAKLHYVWTIHESGALLESPFYTSRDTIRYGPFWQALRRKGVRGHEEMENNVGRGFRYLANMLTPPEPRFGGRRVYHPLGRSSCGVIDPTFMIGAEPWGRTDPAHGQLMRWAYEEQGRPAPDIVGATGGRNLGLTLLGLSQMLTYDLPATPPLRSRRFKGMGTIMRSRVGSDHESNVVFRHDPFCWDLYAANNGAVYFYGKGAPLLPRFGGYWMKQHKQCNLMSIPFGNRVLFAKGNNQSLGSMVSYALLEDVADWSEGITADRHWRRQVLLAKDFERHDPVYLLVRDDVHRPGTPSALHWWVMSQAVQPDGILKPGVVPVTMPGGDAAWFANLGSNWLHQAQAEGRPAPAALQGPRLAFAGQCGVDVDLYLAAPENPTLITDAVGVGDRIPYAVNRLYEYQQLIRVEPRSANGRDAYLTLIVPRLPDSTPPEYETLVGGGGVKVHGGDETAWLFLASNTVDYVEGDIHFNGSAGFCRRSPGRLRLMVRAGSVEAGEIRLRCAATAAAVIEPGRIALYHTGPRAGVSLEGDLPENPPLHIQQVEGE